MSSRTRWTRWRCLALTALVCAVGTRSPNADAASVSSYSWTNDTVHATTDLRVEIDTEDAEISVDAAFRFELSEPFGLPASAAIDTALLAPIMDGSLSVTQASHAIELSRTGGGSVLPEDTKLTFILTGLETPLRAGAVDIGRLVVSNSTHPSVLDVALPSMLVTPGKIWNAQADFSSWISGRAASLQLSAMPANELPVGGSVVITMPESYSSLSSALLGHVSGLDGDVSFSTKLNRISITRVAGTGTSTVGMQTTVALQITGVLHPLLEGPIGSHIRVDTLDAQNQLIDQVYVSTSDVVLRKAQVVVSARFLSVYEGSPSGATYSLQLSAPPTGVQLTILVTEPSAAVTITPDRVVFSPSNWSTPAEVTVVMDDDDVARAPADDFVVVTHTIAEALSTEQTFAAVGSVQLVLEENDLPLVHVSSRYAAVAQGLRNDSYEIVLTSKPSDSVRIDIDPADPFITTIPSYVVFSPSQWNTPQRVAIVPSAPVSADPSTAPHSRRTSVLHSPTSSDPNFGASSHSVVPQSQLLVYYEPLQLDQCVEPCRPGWFSFSNSTSSETLCQPCPLGFVCSGDCASPSPCPTGTFSSSAFAESAAAACQTCPSGSYANQPGMIRCLACPRGASCAHPDRVFEPCPTGTWSGENEAQCHDCPAGSFNNATFQGECVDCPAGCYCPKGSSAPITCEPGAVSLNGGASPCGPCPAGYDCSQSSSLPTQCPEGTYSLAGESVCSECPRGSACAQPDQPPQACPLGTFSGAQSAVCSTCPAGSACANASVSPIPCELGTYSSTPNAVMCRPCPAGHSCADPSVSPSLCALGAYSQEGDYLCRSCPAGKYCSDRYDAPVPCPMGSYSVGNATSCTVCPAGSDCSSPTQAPTTCPGGSYSANGSCVECAAGNYCPSPFVPPKLCLQGTYRYAVITLCLVHSLDSDATLPVHNCSLSGASKCTPCPFGHTCATDSAPVPCDLGDMNNANHTACVPCPKGYECSPLRSAPALCDLGTYSLEGDNECRSCPRGYQCTVTTEPPVRCGSGTFSPAGSTGCFECSPGYYCPDPSMDPVACRPWHYSGPSSTSCTPCPVGYDCTAQSSLPVLCPTGTYNLQLGSSCDKCPAGAACPDPSSPPENCIPGTFSIDGQAQCTPCAPGFYCPYTNQNTQVACLNGTYAEAGSAKCTPCPSGKQCPSTSQHVEQTCPQGTFSLSGQSQCTTCPSGYKCPQVDGSRNAPCALGTYAPGSSTSCTPCPAGYACPDPASDSPIPCVTGSYSTGGAASCTPCPPGYACPDTVSSQRIQCPAGSYASGGAAACTPCPAGYQCLLTNSSSFQPCSPGWYSAAGSAACVQCPRGYFCDTPGEMPKNCSVGSYSLNGSSSCVSCDAGYECPRSDQLPQPCPVGYYSEGGEANCQLCRPGYKCSLASTNPTPPQDECPMGGYCNPPTTFFLCPAGTFGNVTGGESVDHACAPCPEGFYCEMGSTPLTKQVCPPGYFCPEATKRASQYPCSSGTYTPLSGQKSLDACQTCPAGSYCEQGYADPEPCPRGYFCLERTKQADQYPCPAGTFSGPQTGLAVASDCQQCEIGSYCPEASSTPQKCPAGTYNPNVGSAGLHECLDCPPGWSCPQVGQSTFEDRCATGHYCPSGTVLATAKPCPAGTYTERVDLIRAEDCTICPLRHACPQGTGGEAQTMLDCGAGFFCPNGTAYAKQFPCPPGTWSSSTSLADASECDICPKGKYCAGGKSFIDGNCSAGYYCPLGTPSPTKFPCPSGTYTSKTWLFEPSQCDDCPPGYYCPAGSVEPIPCKPGSYSSLNNTERVGPASAWPSCVLCPAGYFCIEASVAPEPCGKGMFSPAGSKACSVCEAGYFCNSETTSSTNMRAEIVSWASPGSLYGKCYNGTYCPPGSDSEPALEIDACPRGYYCPMGTPQPMVCPAGTYSNFTGQDGLDDCVPTPAGQYSLEGALQPAGWCAPGFYCPLRSTSKTQVPCPARYYLNRTGGQSEEDCAVCVAGSYCPKGSAYPIPCPPGLYCRTGVAAPEPCPIGTFANASGLRQVEDCILCSPGMYCDSTGLTVPRGPCDPGYYCTLGAYTSAPMNYESTIFGVSNRHTGAQCPQGAYCPLGSANPTLCPPGTFNNFTGLETESQCVPCPAGQYCETPGLFLPSGGCFAGYFCVGGSSVPTQNATPPGYYSLTGATSPTPCPPGRFNLHSTQEQCVDCPAGFYCGSPATIQPVMCPTGTYCPTSTALPVRCPPGTFSGVEGLVAESQCEACSAGYYCDSYGLSVPSGKCFEGFVCTLSSPVANPVSQAFGSVCPAGYYCPEGSGAAIQCPNGTFRASIGGTSLSSCTPCPGGWYCGGTALTTPTGKCSEGYFCVSQASSATPTDKVTGDICPAGFYCGEATINPGKCAQGTYNLDPGQSVCAPCPAGYFCDGLAVSYAASQCPRGYYCPEGTKRSDEFPCPPGTFGNATGLQDVLQCNPAPGGMFVDSYAAVQPTGSCKSGFYCSGGSASSTPSLGATGGPCLPGTNCPEGSAVPIVCDAGYYCSSTNTDRALPCQEGFYCIQGSFTANPTGQNNSLGMIGNVCSAGHYCPEGTSNPVPCPPGTFSKNTQNIREQDCSPCPPGFLCSESGIVTPSEKCPPGYICTGGEREATQRCSVGFECPEGSSHAAVCLAGTFSDEVGLAQCKLCPQRYFCEQGTIVPQVCPGGFYCPLQTPSAKAFPCLPGSYSNQTGLGAADECTKCPPGKFCSGDPPTDVPTGDCAPGHFCAGGARTAQPVDGATGGYCAGGYMCYGGAWLAAPVDNQTGRACDSGYYCPVGSSAQIRCPKGTYNSFEKRLSCTACPAGSYCDTNSTAPSSCPQRYYCPEGVVEPMLCASGTFGHQSGLERSDQCAACSAGKYCTGGVETASCAAGYYCKMYNDEPNPATPSDASSMDFGGPCPVGHYCPEGVLDPFPCPNATARLETHGSSVDDCGPCPAGMSCEDGAVTITCPRGSYCPFAKSAISCPAGTYNPAEGKQYLEDCLSCDAGKLCNRTGVIDPSGYDCPPGHYCLVAESIPKPCPTGRFRRSAGGKSAGDCQACTGGSYCALGSIEPTVCESKSYCPKGSGLPSACPGGRYCPFNTTEPILCPAGYFCSIASDQPVMCDRGHYCPAGTTAQIPCPLGYIGRETPLSGAYTGLSDSCESCPPGMFGADPNRTTCDVCLEGYVCLGATSSRTPLSREIDKGYQCPAGYFCPGGSSRELACPSGTYQPELGAANLTFCRECPANSYQNVAGQSSCLPCSKSAFSSPGAAKCTCIGSHRAFQMTDGYCICEPGYEFYDQDLILRSDEDDDVDCQPIVYDRCGSNQVRSESGLCMSVSQVSCAKSCNNGTGTYVSSLGLCQCDQQPDLDLICGKSCQESSVQLQVNRTTGGLQLYDPLTGEIESLQSADASQGIISKTSCTTSDCQLHSLTIQASGFSGSYDIPASLSTASSSARRRRLSADLELSIPNPMMCLNVGSGVIFDLSAPDSYPIYLKDSMLNTNPSFDYGAFRSLATKVKSNASSVTAFAFSFTEPGTYVFGNSLNAAAKTVIVIMSDGTSCPTDGPIVPLNEKNLISVSAKRRTDDLILAPDWGLIFGLLGGLFGMVAAIITGLYYFRTKSWTNSSLRRQLAGYRAKSKQADLATVHSKGSLVANKVSTLDAESMAQKPVPTSMIRDGEGDARSPHAADASSEVYQADLGRWDDDDLDIRELVDRLQFHHESVAKCFEDQKGDVKKITQHLQMEAAELKRLFVNALLSSKSASKRSALLPEQDIANPEVTTELVDFSGSAQEQADAKSLERNSFLLENLERELVDRQRYEKRKSGAMEEVNQLLHEVDNWRHGLPELAAALASEMALNLELRADQPETTAASASNTCLEKIQSTLGNLQSALCSDPTTATSSSLIQMVEGEKVRRDIGAFVLEESQRHLHSPLPSTDSGCDRTNDKMKQLLDLHEAVAKAQNLEDEVVYAQVASLHKFGIVVPKVALALSALERDFKTELLRVKEEQNPSKERALKLQLEGKLNKLLVELSKGAAKVSENVHKDSGKVLKCERACHESEAVLAAGLEAAKQQHSAVREQEREKAVAEARARHAVQSSKTRQDSEMEDAKQKTRDETLFQIKDLLVALATELNARHQAATAGNLQAIPALAAYNSPQVLSSLLPSPASAAGKFAAASSTKSLLTAQNQLEELKKRAESAAIDLADSQASMQKQYLEKLEADFPQLLPEERERLVGELSSDLLQLASSLNVETVRSEEDLKGMLAARELAHEKQQQAVQMHAERQESELLQQQHVQEKQLESQFKQEEMEIEQEYLQELSQLEQEFEMAGPDFSEPPEVEDLSGSFEMPNDDDALGDETLEGDDSDIDAEVIEKLCSTYSDAWTDHLAALTSEEAWRKKQLAERLQQKRDARRLMAQRNAMTPLQIDNLTKELVEKEAEELEKIREVISLKRDEYLETLAVKQDALDTARGRAVADAVGGTKAVLTDFVRLQAIVVAKQQGVRLGGQQDEDLESRAADTKTLDPQYDASQRDPASVLLRDTASNGQAVLEPVLGDQRGELASFLEKAEEISLERLNDAATRLAAANDAILQLRSLHNNNLSELDQAVAAELEHQRLVPQSERIAGFLRHRKDAPAEDLISLDPQAEEAIAMYDKVLSDAMAHRARDLEAAEAAAVEASIQLEAASAALDFIREWPGSIAAQGMGEQSAEEALSKESGSANLLAYNAMTEMLPTLIQEETAVHLERLVQEHEAACKDREQRLLAEAASRKAKLGEKMARRRIEAERRASAFPADAELLNTKIDEQEQHELATISAEFESKSKALAELAAHERSELTSLLKAKGDDAAQAIESRLRECRQHFEVEAQKRGGALDAEQARAKQHLLDRLRRKLGRPTSLAADSNSEADALYTTGRQILAAEPAPQVAGYATTLQQLDTEAAQRLHQAKCTHADLTDDLKRVKSEHEAALKELQVAMDAERMRQEQRLQQRIQQRREQHMKRSLSPRETAEAEALIAKQEETEALNLHAQLDMQSEVAIAEESEKQQEEVAVIESQLRQAAADLAAAEMARKVVADLQKVSGAPAVSALEPADENTMATHKRRVAAQLALAKKKMLLRLPLSHQSSAVGVAQTRLSLATDPLHAAIASELESQIVRISEAHIQAWEKRKQELASEEALQKARLAERKRQKLTRHAQSPPADSAASSEPGARDADLVDETALLSERYFYLDADLDSELDMIAASVEDAVSAGVSDLEEQLLACRAVYDRDLSKLRADADIERQRERNALDQCLAARRAGRAVGSPLPVTVVESDQELSAGEELGCIEEKLAANEATLVAALQMSAKMTLDEIVASAKSKSLGQYAEAQEAYTDTEDELSRLKKAHEHGMTELTSALAAERKRQEDKLLERLAKRRDAALKGATANRAVDEEALREQEVLEKERLDTQLREQAARAFQEEADKYEAHELELKAKLLKQQVDVEAASAACAAVDAAGEAELERMRREYFEGKARTSTEDGDVAAASKRRLKARLTNRLKKAEAVKPDSEASFVEAAGEEGDAGADMLLSTIQDLQDAHYRTWKSLQERLDDEARLRKAQLADRLKRKRAELQSNAATGVLTESELDTLIKDLIQDEQTQSALITEEMTGKVAQLQRAAEHQQQNSVDALVESFSDSAAEIERMIEACRQRHEKEKKRLRDEQETERQKQQLSLRERITKRRERLNDRTASHGGSVHDDDASKTETELDELDAQELTELESRLQESETKAWVDHDALQNREVLEITRSLEQDAGKREAGARGKEQAALDELARVTREHREHMKTLRELMDAEKQRKMLELSDRLQKRRDQRLRELKVSGASNADAVQSLEVEDQLGHLALENELAAHNAKSELNELEQQRRVEQELSETLNRAAVNAARAEAARKAVERAQALEADRIQAEYEQRRKELASEHDIRRQEQKNALVGRLAARKQQRAPTPDTGSAAESATATSPATSLNAPSRPDDSMESEIQRVKDAHEVGWQARLDQLERDVAMKKARLMERMQKKRAALLSSSLSSSGSEATPGASEPAVAGLQSEEAEALSAIDAELDAKRAQLQREMEDEQRALQQSLDAAARDKAEELERLLAECKRTHDDESEKLRKQQALERQQQELSLQARLAKKRAQKLSSGGDGHEHDAESGVLVDEAELQEEERAGRELIAKQSEEQDAAALVELQERQRGEVVAIMHELDEEAERRRAAALLQQQEAERQLQRLQQEHRESLEGLNESLAAQKMQQEGKLQQRLLSKRAKKQEELGRVHASEEDAERALQELDREQAAQKVCFEQEWESEISRKLAEASEKQTARELEVTRQLNHAALEAAAADASRKALEAASKAEIERIAAEYESEATAARLQQSADAESQKKRLQDRLAEKRQKKAAQKLKRVASIVQKSTRLFGTSASEAGEADGQSEGEARLKNEQELQQQAEAAARKKQDDARELQQQTVKELERLKEEHENEMKNLNASLLADQKRQEQKLQERIAQRRERKLKEAATSEGEKERLALLEEEEKNEQLALEAELATKAAQRIQEETERQRRKEAELAARIDRAAHEAAAAEAARKAMEAARELEIERLSKEFDEKSRELRQSNQADLASQKKKLEARIAAKKQKKLMELEAKKELELQKLKEKQAKAIEAIEEDKVKMTDALEATCSSGEAGDESLPGGGGDSVEGRGQVHSSGETGENGKLAPDSEAADLEQQQASPNVRHLLNAPHAPNLVADAQQQARDVVAVEQLFTLGLIPLQLPLLAGIEFAVSQRHQAEASALVAAHYDEKMAAVRQGMGDVLQQKAAAKALALSNPDNAAQEKESQLQELNREYDLKIRQREQQLLFDLEQAQHAQTKALKEKQMAQIAFLLNHFAPHHAVAVAKLHAQDSSLSKQQQLQREESARSVDQRASEAENDDADLVNELRARLQVEKNERLRELSDEKQTELRVLDDELGKDLAVLETRFQSLVELETAEINKTFRERLERLNARRSKADDAQRVKLEAEKDAQVSRLVLMLRGRLARQAERLRKLADKRREMLGDEFARKAHVVTAQLMQRVVEERETLARKQAIAKSGDASQLYGLGSSDIRADPSFTRILEERLAKIEGMLRDRLNGAADTASGAEEPKSSAHSEDAGTRSSSPAGSSAAAVVSYRAAIKDAISRGCRAESTLLLSHIEVSVEGLDALRADAVPVEAMNANTRKRLDFATFVLQLAAPQPPTSVSIRKDKQQLAHVVVVKSLSEDDAASDPKTSSSLCAHLDATSQTLYLPAACLADLSTGQLAILVLHALTHAQTKRSDVSDPVFISKMYELLVQCYQNLFQSKQQQQQQPHPPELMQMQTTNTSRPGPQAAPSTAASREWQSRLHEVEGFLSSLERTEGLSSSSSNNSLALPGATSSLERIASLKRLSPSIGSSSSRSLLGKKSPSEMELFVIHERRQLLQEKLDTAEKLYTQVLRQYQEQKESLEYLQEMLTEEQEQAQGEYEGASAPGSAHTTTTQHEVAELEAALRDALGQPRTPRS